MNDTTGNDIDDATVTKTHTVIGVLAGTASALAIVGVAWWQHWYKFFIGWAAVKIGAKVAVVAVAGCVAFAARRRKRQQRRAAQQEGPAPLPEQGA